jgi:hypothetical protein
MTSPDPNQMSKYCGEAMPHMLVNACVVDRDLAHRIGVDVLGRAEALASLSTREQDVLIAPFVEKVFDHEPLDAPLDLKAKVIQPACHQRPWTEQLDLVGGDVLYAGRRAGGMVVALHDSSGSIPP